MRVIKPSRIAEFYRLHPKAKSSLEGWLAIAQDAEWSNLVELKRTFSSADQVRLSPDKLVIVFNIKGNDFRLICAVHFNTGIVFVLRFLTHAEYDKNKWKSEL